MATKALVISGVDFSTQRVSLPLAHIPPYGRNLKHILMTSKYNVTTGTLVDPIGEDFTVPVLTTALKPTKQTSANFGNKEAMGFLREVGNRKCLLGNVNLASKEITIHIVYTNSSAIATTVDRILLAFISPLVNNSQKMLRIHSSGSNTKVRISNSVSVGPFVPEQSSNFTTTTYDTAVDAVNNTKVIQTFKINIATSTIYVYNNGVPAGSINVPNLVEWTGQLYVGVNPIRNDNIADASGLIGGVYMYDEGQSDTRIAAMYTFLNAAFS